MKKYIFILATILMTACSSNNNNLFKTITYNTQINDKNLNLNYTFDAEIQLPDKNHSNQYATLHDNIIISILGSEFIKYSDKKALTIYADSSYAEYKKIYDEIFEYNPVEPTDTIHFATDIQGRVLYSDSTIVSYQRTLYTYAGGAHGMNTKTNYVFNLKTGKLLTEEDLFGKDFERKIQKRLTEKANILRQQDILPEEDIFYSNSNITPNGNFAITDTSIIYTFNPYEIAPYVYGIIDIEITKN